jgi:glc operon protein GlcG
VIHPHMRACVVFVSIVTSVLLSVGNSGASAQSSGPTTMTKQTITLDGANAIVTAALAHAKVLGIQEVIAIYDDSEILKALVSMDGARVTSVNFALDKAYTSARRQAATQDLADTFASAPTVTMQSFLKQPRLTLLGGGIPIMVNGQVVGGIGASGGTIAQDIEVADAGLAAIQH